MNPPILTTPRNSTHEITAASQAVTDGINRVIPTVTAAADACSKSAHQAKEYVRGHPTSSLLLAIGFSVAAVLVVRALTPPPPRNRALRLLEDIQQHLSELTQPVYERASHLVEDGAGKFSRSIDNLGDLHIDKRINKMSRWVRNLTA